RLALQLDAGGRLVLSAAGFQHDLRLNRCRVRGARTADREGRGDSDFAVLCGAAQAQLAALLLRQERFDARTGCRAPARAVARESPVGHCRVFSMRTAAACSAVCSASLISLARLHTAVAGATGVA